MNTNNRTFAWLASLAVALAGSTACKKVAIPREEQTDSFNRIYMAAAARNPNITTLKMLDSTYTITYGASYGGYGTPAEDIEVQFTVDAEAASAYNKTNGTNYPLLPASAYELKQSSAVLPKGGVATAPLALAINPGKGLELFKEYIIAVTLTSAKSNVPVSTTLRTVYFIVKASLDFADFPEFDRSSWSILGVSSEEPAEGSNGGLGIHAIDNNTATFWHTQWNGGYPPPPHWIAVDMGAAKLLHGLSFTGRQSTNNGKPNVVLVEISTNATDWQALGTLQLQNINAVQKFFLPSFQQARYVRLMILSNYGNTQYTHLAELKAF